MNRARDADSLAPSALFPSQFGFGSVRQLNLREDITFAAFNSLHQAWCANQPFDNVDLYSLMAEILKIKPAKTDGSIAPLCSILMNPPASCAVPRSQP